MALRLKYAGLDPSKLVILDKALKRGAKVEAKEGCYYLRIKDPRRKKALSLSLRD